ncbi:uncharacterized protein LOC119371814 [Rhipicephalus sanguineus]|uniref:Uncharacterized protein n=1 Tax=Rhipicephalus sanguineus TaxID=34632 RepID=A0A9D4QCR2_RHISA|nr:uncharacterized protein LOC119371814 [Rhipicephalus sanguineus]KAH7975576.1 hypothetical protein HPB52_003256 [Rhipicephalus sanguineus]
MGGGAKQLEDAAASSRRQPSAGPPTSAAADLTVDARGPEDVDDGCDAPAAANGDGHHPLVWLAILKVGLMADPAWCSGAIHERARRLWLAFHRLEPPDGHLRQMALETAPPWEPLAATLWKSITSVRDLWEQQPPVTTTHTTLAAAALFLWQGCAQWPAQEDNSRKDTCCCSCCPHQGSSCPDSTLLRAITASECEVSADKGTRCQIDYDWGLGQAKLLHAVWATGPCQATRCCPNLGKPWPWEGAELLLPLVLSQGLSWAALVRTDTAPCA